MSFAHPEDAPALLEQFLHDVANTPAETTHLLQELQAKDAQIQAFRDEIGKRDAQLQKFVRLNGGHVHNPKEEPFSKVIGECFDRAEVLQAEKCGLSERALAVLERQIKRLDVGLRALAHREEFPSDWGGPSLVSGLGSGPGTGMTTPAVATGGALPLQTVSGNIGTAGGIPNVAQIRLAAQQQHGSRPLKSGDQTPTGAGAVARSQRESSSEAGNKRRRLNASLGTLPTAQSSLRQSSLGPGTPKASTPAAGSRAGSAQPPTKAGQAQKKGVQAVAATTAANKKPPPASHSSNASRKRVRNATQKKGDRRRQLARGESATPSTTSSDRDSASPSPSALPNKTDGAADSKLRSHTAASSSEEEEDDENDTNLYCYCQKVSYGDMVGCDNDNCEYQWFHWDCVELKSEPEGTWLCPTCRKLPKNKVVLSGR